MTRPGGRRLSGAESIDLSFCLDPAGLSLQYSNGHSPTHRWYRQNIPRNSAKHCIEAFVLHKGLLTVVDIFTLPQWYPQEVPAPLEENSGTYLSDPLHTTTNPAKRNWKGLLTRVSASFQDNSTKIHNNPKAIKKQDFHLSFKSILNVHRTHFQSTYHYITDDQHVWKGKELISNKNSFLFLSLQYIRVFFAVYISASSFLDFVV